MKFKELGLSDDLSRALKDKGYSKPTPIQTKAIPAILSGKDIMAAAQTGTGKTAGFTLPILQLLSDKPKIKSNRVRALILAPTRELAAQVQENIFTYSSSDLSYVCRITATRWDEVVFRCIFCNYLD